MILGTNLHLVNGIAEKVHKVRGQRLRSWLNAIMAEAWIFIVWHRGSLQVTCSAEKELATINK